MLQISDVRQDFGVKIAASNKAPKEPFSSRGSGSMRLQPIAGWSFQVSFQSVFGFFQIVDFPLGS
jgi:hypothetical protein